MLNLNIFQLAQSLRHRDPSVGAVKMNTPDAPHTWSAERIMELSKEAVQRSGDSEGVSALIQALHSSLNDCYHPTRELGKSGSVKDLQLQIIEQLIAVSADRLRASLLGGKTKEVESTISELSQWVLAKSMCNAIRPDPQNADSTVTSPFDAKACIQELSEQLKCGAMSSMALLVDSAFHGDVALFEMLLSQPEEPDVVVQNFHAMFTQPLLATMQKYSPDSVGESSGMSPPEGNLESSNGLPSVRSGNFASFSAAGVCIVAGRIMALRQMEALPLVEEGEEWGMFATLVRDLDEASSNDPDAAAAEQEDSPSRGAGPLQSIRRRYLRRIATRMRCSVKLMQAADALSAGDTKKACVICAEVETFSHEAGPSTTFEAMEHFTRALCAHGSALQAQQTAMQHLALAEVAWRTEIQTYRRGLRLMKSHSLLVESYFAGSQWDNAQRHVFQALSLKPRVEKLAELQSDVDAVDSITQRITNACWQLYLHMDDRVSSATHFYNYVQRLKTRQFSATGVSAAATIEELIDAYEKRAELLMKVSVVAKVSTGAEEEEAISMFKVAIDSCAQLDRNDLDRKATDRLDERLIALECSIASAYAALASKEGNKKGRRTIVNEALSFAFRAKGKGRPPLRTAEATLIVAEALQEVGQYRKAAMYAEDIPSLESEVERVGQDVVQELKLRARVTSSRCRTHFDPKTALNELNGLITELEERQSALQAKQETEESAVSLSIRAFESRQRYNQQALDRNRLLLAAVHSGVGDAQMVLHKYEDALEPYSHGLSLYSEGVHEVKEAATMGALGAVYCALGKHSTALTYLKQMKDSATELSHHRMVYEANGQMASAFATMGNHSEAMALWSTLVQTARQFDDPQVERETTCSLIRAHQQHGAHKEVLDAAAALEKLATGPDGAEDRAFAIHAMAEAYLNLSEYQKSVNAADKIESIEGLQQSSTKVDLAAIHSIRARALIGLREDDAAIDVLQEWVSRAKASGNPLETGKANVALADALSEASPMEARTCYFAAIDACRSAKFYGTLSPNKAQSGDEFSEVLYKASRWLLHNYYLEEEPIEVVSDGLLEQDTFGSQPTMTFNFDDEAPGTLDDVEEDEEDELDVSGDGNPLLGADTFGESPPDRRLSRAHTEDMPETKTILALNYNVALEVVEVALRFTLGYSPKYVERTPRTSLEIALAQPVTWVVITAKVDPFDEALSEIPYNILIRPAGYPSFVQHAAKLKASVLKNYHSIQKVMGTDDLYLSLRGMFEALWDPVFKTLSSIPIAMQGESGDCVCVVPDPSLLHVPFAALVSAQRKTVAQRSAVTVVPSFDLVAASVALNTDKRTLEQERQVDPSVFISEREAVASSPVSLSTPQFASHEVFNSDWNIVVGATRKQILQRLSSATGNACVLLDAAEDHGLRVADGTISIAELESVTLDKDLHFLVIVNDRSQRPTPAAPGYPSRFASQGVRVLRLDLAPHAAVSSQHEHFVKSFFQHLGTALKHRLINPYAVAYQAAHCDAIRSHVPPHVWASFTLIGAP